MLAVARVVPEDRARPESPPIADVRWTRAGSFVAASAAIVLAAYLAHPLLHGYTLPIGPDGPVYGWWMRYGEAAGLGAVPGGRPGVPAIALALRPLLGTGTLGTVTVLGPVLAVVCALAGAGLLEVAAGPSLARALVAVALTGSFAAFLAGGWLGNTALVALFLAAAAALAVARSSWRAVALAAVLLGASAVTHRIVLALVLAILGGTMGLLLPDALRARRAGGPLRDSYAGRIAIAVGAGLGLGALALAGGGAGPRIPGDTSQDGFFRRLGLRDLLVDRYRERLGGDLARAPVPLGTGTLLGAYGFAGGRRPEGDRGRYLAAFLASWAIVTVVGLVSFALSGWAPPNRMLAFAFFLPLAAAVGAGAAFHTGRAAARVLALAGVVAFAAFSMVGWYRQSPAFTQEELEVASAAGEVVRAAPDGTPVVFLVDTDQPAAAYHVTRAANVLRLGVPPDRIPDVRLAVGLPDDFLAGRPTLSGDPEHDSIATAYAADALGVDRPLVLVARPFNPRGHEDAFARGQAVATDIVALEDPSLAPAPSPRLTFEPLEGTPSPIVLVAASVAAFMVVTVAGVGWARWGLPGAGRRAVAALAPAVGLAVFLAAAVLVDATGLDLGGPSGPIVAATLALIGYALAFSASARRDRLE